MEGQKYVFLFYQREFIPRLDSQIMQMVQVGHQNNIAFNHAITTLQDFFKRDISFDVDLGQDILRINEKSHSIIQ
jgi:hypothetical protein